MTALVPERSSRRRIFVGDVQGCLVELEALLRATDYDPTADELFFVGDLIRKGPESAGVLRLVRDLKATCVLGNHDFDVLNGGKCPADLAQAEDREALFDLMASWPWLVALGDILLVHAAAPPRCWHLKAKDPIEGPSDVVTAAEERSFALTARYCDARGRRPTSDWPPPPPPFAPWHSFYEGERRVVYGHWARQGLQRGDRTIGLDTGCVYGKELTAWIAEEDRIVQVAGRR